MHLRQAIPAPHGLCKPKTNLSCLLQVFVRLGSGAHQRGITGPGHQLRHLLHQTRILTDLRQQQDAVARFCIC